MHILMSHKKLQWALTTASRFSAIGTGAFGFPRFTFEGDKDILSVTTGSHTCAAKIEMPGIDIKADGAVTVPSVLMQNIVSALSADHVELEVRDKYLMITTDTGSEFSINTIENADSRSFPEEDAYSNSSEVAPQDLQNALRRVVFAASVDETSRPLLASVCLSTEDDGLVTVSTDSYRLARAVSGDSPITLDGEAILPAKVAKELVRLFAAEAKESEPTNVQVDWTENHARFRCGEITVCSQLIAGDYPNYQGLIPTEHETVVTFDKGSLINALKLMQPVLDNYKTSCKLETAKKGKLCVFKAGSDEGSAKVEVTPTKFKGEQVEVSFNPEYMADGVAAIEGDSVEIRFNGSTKPMLVQSGADDGYLFLCMPIRS